MIVEGTKIPKADAIAHLAKWHSAATHVRATYRAITGTSFVIGRIRELSPTTIRIVGMDAEMFFYLRDTSEFVYKDARGPQNESNRNRDNKYPTIIDVKFNTGEGLTILEYFSE